MASKALRNVFRLIELAFLKDPAYGGKGDDVTNDTPAITAGLADARTLRLGSGTYRQTAGADLISTSRNIIGEGRASVLKLNNSASPTNSQLRLGAVGAGTVYTTTGALTLGQKAFTLNTVVGLAVGDQVQMRMGIDPYDPNEEIIRLFNQVESIAGSDVTFRTPLPEACAASTHEIEKFGEIVENFIVENLTLDYVAGSTPDQHIILQSVRNAHVRNILALKNAGAVVEVRESENVTVENIYAQRSDDSVHSTAGRVIAGWGMRNCVFRNIYAEDADASVVFIESQCRDVLFENLQIHSGPGRNAASNFVDVAGGCRNIRFRRLYVNAQVSCSFNVVETSEVFTEDVTLIGAIKSFPLRNHTGYLRFNGKTYDRHKRYSRRIKLEPNWVDKQFAIPSGIWKKVRVYLNTKTGLTNFFILNTSGNGPDVLSMLAADAANDIELSGAVTLSRCGTDTPFNDVDTKRLHIYSDGTVPADAYAVIEVDYIEEASAEDDLTHCQIGDYAAQQEMHGDVTIADAATTGQVLFSVNMADAEFYVIATPTLRTGAAAAGSNRILSIAKAVGSFTITLEAAPGAGTSQRFDWRVVR